MTNGETAVRKTPLPLLSDLPVATLVKSAPKWMECPNWALTQDTSAAAEVLQRHFSSVDKALRCGGYGWQMLFLNARGRWAVVYCLTKKAGSHCCSDFRRVMMKSSILPRDER